MRIKKKSLMTFIIIFGVVFLAGVIIYFQSADNNSGIPVSLAKCIGEHSQLYVQLGCHFCAEQESLFGSSYQYLNKTDCYYNPQPCVALNITGTPTWIINSQKYLGVQSIDELKNLTGC